eukprot:TRINITY_DN937_c0_g1_i1.p1 TRINITY_DN937_c0_g1~~TRINITY_DN937_c0_g1_i1.p1  ORF type:complete len:508 (-),score=137.72 TRINITY_DN937_c0_g1_i1:123-1646(-)
MSKFSEDLLVSHEGFDLYYNRVDDDLKSFGEIQSFFKKFAATEAGYAKELSRLSKTVDPKLWRRTGKELGTLANCWNQLHNEIDRLAKAHEELAATITRDVVNELGTWIKEKEKTQINLNKSGTKLRKDMNDTLRSLKEAKENYYKLHKSSDQANATYSTKKNEPQIKPKEVDKLKKKANEARERATAADSNYKKVLEKANAHQTKFYTSEMPSLLDEFQRFEEDKTACYKKIMEDYMSNFSKFPALLTNVCDTLNASVAAVDQQQDICTFISDFKNNGVTPPPPIEYQPYDTASGDSVGISSSGSGVSTSSISINHSSTPATSFHSPRDSTDKIEKSDVRMDWGLVAADESLSPEQKKEKLEGQLKEIKGVIAAETKSQKGLDKLVKFYANDPVAQKKASQEASDQRGKVDKLQEEKQKITAQLSALGEGGDAVGDERSAGGSDAEDYVEIKAKALFDYEAANETELTFKAGDVLIVTEQDQSGWWYAELNGKQGFVPNNYVEEIK